VSYDYIRVEDVLAIHSDLIDRFGGIRGIRDAGLLESALFRPQTGHYALLIDEASALWESLSQNHPFVDGNKRTAFAATYVFLLINGIRIVATDREAQAFILDLYDSDQLEFHRLQAWLIQNTKPL
jgi:death-on-curing protein